jgi:hypothetical protein
MMISCYIYILIHTISVTCQPTMKMNIHNQCSNFKLTTPNWFKYSVDWNKEPNDEVDAGSTMSVDLTSYWAVSDGNLTYHLQRNCGASDNQLKSTSTLLFIGWRSEGYKKPHVFVYLIEYDEQIKWNYHKLREYRQRYYSQLSTYTGPIKDTWLIHDGAVLMTRLELDFTQRDCVLNITISEEVVDDHAKIPSWISPKT